MTKNDLQMCIYFLERTVPAGFNEQEQLIHLVEKLHKEVSKREKKND